MIRGLFCACLWVGLSGVQVLADCTVAIQESATRSLATNLAEGPDNLRSVTVQRIQQGIGSGAFSQPLSDPCLNYLVGRYFVQQKDYETAREFLVAAVEGAPTPISGDFAPYNVIGYTHLLEGNFEWALKAFNTQTQSPGFEQLDSATKMKVMNNAGYTAIQLGRYDMAIDSLKKAEALGSTVATRNLAVVESIVTTLKSGDLDQPGIFSTVAISVKSADRVQAAVDKLQSQAGASTKEIGVFQTETGFFAVTMGAYESYPKAEQRLSKVRSAGFGDAYISSVSEWDNVTAKFVSP